MCLAVGTGQLSGRRRRSGFDVRPEFIDSHPFMDDGDHTFLILNQLLSHMGVFATLFAYHIRESLA